MRGSVAYIGESVVSPHGRSMASSPAAGRSVSEFTGEVNIIGNLNMHSKKAAPVVHMTTGELDGVNLYPGDLLMDPATRTSGHRIVRECVTEGTIGTAGAITANTTAGSLVAQVSSIEGLRTNQYIVIAGAGFTSKRILAIDGRNMEIHLNSVASIVTQSGGALSYVAPTFRNGQFIPVVGSKTWDPPSVASSAMTSTTVTATGAVVGDFATAALAIAMPAGCALVAEVTAANTVTVSLINLSGSTQDPASGTLRVHVRSQ
jgi:hypothetical protein